MKPTKLQVSPDLVMIKSFWIVISSMMMHPCLRNSNNILLSISIHMKLASLNHWVFVVLQCSLERSCTKLLDFLWWISKPFLQFSNWDFNRNIKFSGISVFITKFSIYSISLWLLWLNTMLSVSGLEQPISSLWGALILPSLWGVGFAFTVRNFAHLCWSIT